MITKMRIFVLALCCAFSMSAFAELKVAVVNAQRALFDSDRAKSYSKKMEKDLGSDLENVKKIEKEIVKIQEQMKKDGDIMSDEQKREMKNKMDEKKQDYKFYASKLQKAKQQAEEEFLRENMPLLDKALKQIIDEEKYDLVLQQQPAPSGAVIFAGEAVDVTKKLLEKLNKL